MLNWVVIAFYNLKIASSTFLVIAMIASCLYSVSLFLSSWSCLIDHISLLDFCLFKLWCAAFNNIILSIDSVNLSFVPWVNVTSMQILRGSFKSCGVNISSRSNWQKPDRDEWGTGLEAMQTALSLEKNVNQALLDLHKIADTHGDAQVNKT